jgi:hypothetical protein
MSLVATAEGHDLVSPILTVFIIIVAILAMRRYGIHLIPIFVLVGSFVTAVAVRYLAIVADQGIKAAAESKVGGKFGSWLLLLPVRAFPDHSLSAMAPEIIRRIAARWIRLAGGAICAAIWLLGPPIFSALLLIFAFLSTPFVSGCTSFPYYSHGRLFYEVVILSDPLAGKTR